MFNWTRVNKHNVSLPSKLHFPEEQRKHLLGTRAKNNCGKLVWEKLHLATEALCPQCLWTERAVKCSGKLGESNCQTQQKTLCPASNIKLLRVVHQFMFSECKVRLSLPGTRSNNNNTQVSSCNVIELPLMNLWFSSAVRHRAKLETDAVNTEMKTLAELSCLYTAQWSMLWSKRGGPFWNGLWFHNKKACGCFIWTHCKVKKTE